MTTKITVKDNGPLRLEGDFEIYDAAGERYDLGAVSYTHLDVYKRQASEQLSPVADRQSICSHRNHSRVERAMGVTAKQLGLDCSAYRDA